MNWKRYKFLILSAAFSLIAGIILLGLIFHRGAQASELRSEVIRLKGSQAQLTGMSPFPSESSYRFLRDKNRALNERRSELKEIILENQIAPIQMNRSMFGDFVRTQFVPPLIAGAEAATTGGEDGVILRDPSFGLQEYLDGALPDPQEIRTLMVRLESMRHLSLVMFGAGISELVRIEPVSRDERVRTGPRQRTPASGTGGLFAGGQRSAARAEDSPASAEQTDTRRNELFESVSFTVSVKIYEDKLWRLLNRFASDENQIVVRNLSVTNSNQQLWPSYLRPDPRMGGASTRSAAAAPRSDRRPDDSLLAALMNQGETAPRTEEVPTAVPGLRDRRARTVGGELLNVSFDITFYRLKPVAQGS